MGIAAAALLAGFLYPPIVTHLAERSREAFL
jgi:hypothetical protein